MSHAEAAALIATLEQVAPTAPTACSGWSAHHIVAHLAAGSQEIADLIEEQLDGRGSRPTRLWEDREPRYRSLTPEELRREWFHQIGRKLNAEQALADRGPDCTFDFTGMAMTAAQLDVHSRSEAAIHRWDIVVRVDGYHDDVGDELLAQPELTAHAVTVLNAMPILNESAHTRMQHLGRPLSIVLRTEGQSDVILSTRDGTNGALRFDDEGAGCGDAIVDTDAAHRLLILWGRRSRTHPLAVQCDPALLPSVTATLWARGAEM